MLQFREIKEEDLSAIFYDKELRSLVTIDTKGERVFAMIVEDDKKIVGGISGSVLGKNAFVNSIVVKRNEQENLYKDGLYRALINKLDLKGIDYLFAFDYDPTLENVGFKQIDKDKPNNICGPVINELNIKDNAYWIKIKNFFDKKK
ncbi:MAG TPA: hypothetical protein VFD33_05735 [Bacillota bacterium]|nr:hypothetical protein [Bacillota bacterium]